MPLKCLITGISGQTGAYLAAELLRAGHSVDGTSRTDAPDLWRLKHLDIDDRVKIHALNASEPEEILRLTTRGYDRIFHLAAESSVAASLKDPAGTVRANMLQTTAWLAAIRDHSPQTRFFNAASSEVLAPGEGLLNEESPRRATNPYAVTKAAAMDMGHVFRSSFDLYIVSGILFNHESELRDPRFVTGKIITNLCRMAAGPKEPPFELGNIEAQRDFSHAEDFARGIAASLEAETAQDYVFASGQLSSVKDFFNAAARHVGFVPVWSGSGTQAVCKDKETGRKLVSINPEFYRPIDEAGKAGDASRAKQALGWQRRIDFDTMIGRMISYHSRDNA